MTIQRGGGERSRCWGGSGRLFCLNRFKKKKWKNSQGTESDPNRASAISSRRLHLSKSAVRWSRMHRGSNGFGSLAMPWQQWKHPDLWWHSKNVVYVAKHSIRHGRFHGRRQHTARETIFWAFGFLGNHILSLHSWRPFEDGFFPYGSSRRALLGSVEKMRNVFCPRRTGGGESKPERDPMCVCLFDCGSVLVWVCMCMHVCLDKLEAAREASTKTQCESICLLADCGGKLPIFYIAFWYITKTP